jgi:hypothetical protein
LVRNLAAKYDVVLDEDSDSASLEELTLLLGCIPSAIESFIKSYAAHEKALDAADACRQLLNSSFNMSFWEQSGMASSSVLLKIFQHIGTSPPELGLLALLLGQFSKRIPLDPALLMACLELCGSKPESSYSGITQDSPGRIRELNSEIQTLTADNTIRYADLGIQYAEFISLLLSHGLLQFDDPQFHHLLPQENMRKSDILFGKWIYIHPLLTDILRDRARHSDFDCIRDRIQRSFILYREVLLMRHRDSRFKRLFVSENLLNFISYPSMPLGSISAPPVTTLARVSAYTMRYITSLLEFQADSLSTSEPETIRLHSAMIPLIMQGICEDFTSWHTLWVEEHSHNPLQQRIARTFQQRIAVIATVETALGLCSIYARDRNWPRLIQLAASADDTIRKINQPPGEDLNSLSSKVDEFLYLENKASLVLSGPYQEIKIYSEEVFDLNSTFLKVRSQIDGMDLKMSSRDMQEDFLFRSRKLVAKPIHIQAEIQVKQKIIQDIESKTWDLAWVLKWRTELAIILCKEKNYWEALDQLVHLQVVIMKFRLVAYCQPSRVNACFVDQIAFVFYLYGHIAMSLCGTQNKQFAQYMFSACAQLCIGGYSWTQRVLRLSCLDIICTSGCATEKPLWKECIGFLDLFYSKSTSARRLGARNLDGSRGYGEDFDEAEDYVLFGHKPRHAVYFLERRLFTRYEGKYSTIDLNDGDYVTGLRAGLFFKIIFMSVGGVDYQVEKKDSLFGVLAQDHPAKHYLEKVLELDKDQLCEYLCIISCFVLATLLVNSSKDVKDNEVEISTFIAEAEVVMFGNEEFLDEYYSRRLLDDSIVLHFKNTREGKYVGFHSIFIHISAIANVRHENRAFKWLRVPAILKITAKRYCRQYGKRSFGRASKAAFWRLQEWTQHQKRQI